MHLACTWRATRRGAVRAGSGFPVGHSTGGCPCAYARFISGGLRLLAGAGFCPPESAPHQSGWDWLCGLCPLSQQGDSCAGLRQILGGSFACRPGTTLLSWPRPVAAPRGAPSRPGCGGAVDERARSQWPAEEEWSAALAGGRAPGRGDPLMSVLLGGRRRVHSRPAWNCSCWGRCGAWAL